MPMTLCYWRRDDIAPADGHLMGTAHKPEMVQSIQICFVDPAEALLSRWPLRGVSTLRPAGEKIQRERDGAATAAAAIARALFIPGSSLDPLASSSLHCVANCGYFGSCRASDGAVVTTQPYSYHWACNETMDFFIRVLTACLPCVHCLLLLPVGKRRNVPPSHFQEISFW